MSQIQKRAIVYGSYILRWLLQQILASMAHVFATAEGVFICLRN